MRGGVRGATVRGGAAMREGTGLTARGAGVFLGIATGRGMALGRMSRGATRRGMGATTADGCGLAIGRRGAGAGTARRTGMALMSRKGDVGDAGVGRRDTAVARRTGVGRSARTARETPCGKADLMGSPESAPGAGPSATSGAMVAVRRPRGTGAGASLELVSVRPERAGKSRVGGPSNGPGRVETQGSRRGGRAATTFPSSVSVTACLRRRPSSPRSRRRRSRSPRWRWPRSNRWRRSCRCRSRARWSR